MTMNREATVGKYRFEAELHWTRGTGKNWKAIIDKPFPIDYYSPGGLNESGGLRSTEANDETYLGYIHEILDQRDEITIACPVMYTSRFTRADWQLSNIAVYTYQERHPMGAFICSIAARRVSMVKKGQQLMIYSMASQVVGYIGHKQ